MTGGRRLRRDAQVVESARGAPQLPFRDRHSSGEPVAVGRLVGAPQPASERRPVVGGDRKAAELLAGAARELPKSLVVEWLKRRPDDAALRQEAGSGQVEQAREEFASREVAGRAEQHHDLGLEGRGRADCCVIRLLIVHARNANCAAMSAPWPRGKTLGRRGHRAQTTRARRAQDSSM